MPCGGSAKPCRTAKLSHDAMLLNPTTRADRAGLRLMNDEA
jgi:hypothetical protein